MALTFRCPTHRAAWSSNAVNNRSSPTLRPRPRAGERRKWELVCPGSAPSADRGARRAGSTSGRLPGFAKTCSRSIRARLPQPDRGEEASAAGGLPFRYYFVGQQGSNGYVRLGRRRRRRARPRFRTGLRGRGRRGGRQGPRALRANAPRILDPAARARARDAFRFPWRGCSRTGRSALVGSSRIAPSFTRRPPARQSNRSRRAGGSRKSTFSKKKPRKGGAYLRIGEKAWLRARDVRRPVPTPLRRPSIRPGERWIDVDLATQTLLACEGESPFLRRWSRPAKGAKGATARRPKGSFASGSSSRARTWTTSRTTDAARYYAIEDVPYVQYFAKGVGLHGAFWHRGFGHERSHGCVNLAPLDAQRLFAFTSPHLPAGWTAVLPTSVESGTLVRVR